MMPRMPIRGFAPVIRTILLNDWHVAGVRTSSLAVFRGVPAVERVHLVGRERWRVAVGTGEVHRAGRVLTHHGRRAPGPRADGTPHHRGPRWPGGGAWAV